MLLQSAFWDHPELCTESGLREFLAAEAAETRGSDRYLWAVTRLLDGGRVKDVRAFLSWNEIAQWLPHLKLREDSRAKWTRLLEVYAAKRT